MYKGKCCPLHLNWLVMMEMEFHSWILLSVLRQGLLLWLYYAWFIPELCNFYTKNSLGAKQIKYFDKHPCQHFEEECTFPDRVILLTPTFLRNCEEFSWKVLAHFWRNISIICYIDNRCEVERKNTCTKLLQFGAVSWNHFPWILLYLYTCMSKV